MLPAPQRSARVARHPASDRIQPGADRGPIRKGSRSLRQHQKCGLEGIVGSVSISQQSAAGSMYHWPVPANQFRERIFIALADESLQQLRVVVTGLSQ